MSPKLTAVLARLCQRLGPIFSTQAVKLPYLVDVVAGQVIGAPIAEGTYQTWEHGVVAREVFRFIKYEAGTSSLFSVEPHSYSESGIRIGVVDGIEVESVLSPEEIRIVDFVADEYGHIQPEQLGYLTKRLNTDVSPEMWGTNRMAAVNEEAFMRLSPAWQHLCQKIGEADLDDRSQWSEPINEDPLAALTRALHG